MTRKYKKVPPEQKLIEGNTPMTTSPSGRKYPMTEKQIEGRKRGGFQPGQSGNPKGRPVDDPALKASIRSKLPNLIERLEDIALNGNNEASSVKAIETMLSYVLSKAASKQEIDVAVTHSDLLTRLAKARELPLELTDYEVIEQDKQQ